MPGEPKCHGCASCDGSPEALAPTSTDDLAKRVKILREAGVRAYKDGPLELVFAPPPKTSLTLEERMLIDRSAADQTR